MKKITLALCALCTVIFSYVKADQEKRTVLLWTFAPFNYEEWEKRKEVIDTKFNIDLQIEMVAQNAFVQKLQAVMMEGENVPDIIEWMIENNRILSSNPKKSFVIPLNKYVQKSDLISQVCEGRFSWLTYGKNIYGLPHDAHPAVLMYNDTIWKRAGVDVAKIETWDEFFEESKKLQKLKKNGKQVHFALPTGNDGLEDTMFMIWQQSGAQILTEDGRPNFNSPEFIKFLKKWEKWMNTGSMTKWDWGNFSKLIENGTYASYIATDWWLSQSDLAAKSGKYDLKLRNLPVYNKGMKCGSSWGGSFLAIPQGTKDPEKIYNIIKYMQYDQSALKVRYEVTGMLPPLKKLWSDDFFNEDDPRFGNTKTARIQIKSAENIPSVVSGDYFWDFIHDFNFQYSDYFVNKKISFDEMIANTQEITTRRLR